MLLVDNSLSKKNENLWHRNKEEVSRKNKILKIITFSQMNHPEVSNIPNEISTESVIR
jgi:hypothetical protein